MKDVGEAMDTIGDLRDDQSQDQASDGDPAASALVAEAATASLGRSVRGTATVVSSPEPLVISQFEYDASGALSMRVLTGDTAIPAEEASIELGKALSRGVAADIWIDDNKLIRRFSLDATSIPAGVVSDPGTGETHVSQLVFDFRDFNADISIDAPPVELVVGDVSSIGP